MREERKRVEERWRKVRWMWMWMCPARKEDGSGLQWDGAVDDHHAWLFPAAGLSSATVACRGKKVASPVLAATGRLLHLYPRFSLL